MKSWHFKGLGAGLDGLQLRERDIPQPGPREVLVRVHACSLNYREIAILKLGRYPLPFGFEEAPAALAWYAEGKAFGKTVIRVAP
jgi:hypothetical protein